VARGFLYWNRGFHWEMAFRQESLLSVHPIRQGSPGASSGGVCKPGIMGGFQSPSGGAGLLVGRGSLWV
jgi:hypothetical protein